jgi:hypothetical protein
MNRGRVSAFYSLESEMKSKILNRKNMYVNLMDRSSVILHEQLALRRLKELQAKERKRWVRALLHSLWSALFTRVELKREIGPGRLPAEWHEVEKDRAWRAMQQL